MVSVHSQQKLIDCIVFKIFCSSGIYTRIVPGFGKFLLQLGEPVIVLRYPGGISRLIFLRQRLVCCVSSQVILYGILTFVLFCTSYGELLPQRPELGNVAFRF